MGLKHDPLQQPTNQSMDKLPGYPPDDSGFDQRFLTAPIKSAVDKFQLLPEFLKIRGLVKQHLDSFNYFVRTDIKKIVRANNLIVATRYPHIYLRFLNVRIGKPEIIFHGSHEDLTPHTCRLSDQTYAAPILVDVEYTQGSHDDPRKERKTDVVIGRMPIMLRSCCCVLYGRDEAELATLGECPLDPGGYSVIKGTEKVILIQEQLSKNRIIIDTDKKANITASVTSSTEKIKTKTVIVMEKEKLWLQLNQFPKKVPLMVVMKAMGMQSDQEVIQMVGRDPRYSLLLLPSIEECTKCKVYTREQALEYLDSKSLLPLMDFRNKKGVKANILKRCSLRVKCFIETDGGFKPTMSKTDLAHYNPFTIALKNLGNKVSGNQNDVVVEIRKATKLLTPLQLEREYQEWIIQMHHQYDEEADSGEDQPVIIVNPENKKALGISSDVIRIHQVINRKGKCWKHGQKIKVLKGACAGCHKTTVYATIEYFLLEGFEGDAGGEARIICRPIDIQDENGCSLEVRDEVTHLDICSSLSLPMSVIDLGKLVVVGSTEWENRLNMKKKKSSASIGLLGSNHFQQRDFDGMDSNCKSFEKKGIVKPSFPAGKYEFLTNEQSEPLDVRVGFTFRSLSIACYDTYNNRAPFESIPDLTVKLQADNDMHFEVRGMKITLSTDKLTLEIKDAKVISNELDKIRPNYRATLFIASRHVPMSLSIPCQVYPGLLKHVELKPKIIEDQLHPGFIFKELILEMLDAYGNHVMKGLEVTIAVIGFNILDNIGMTRKVDDKGRIDFGGLLKLIAGYGKNASISVKFGNNTIFKQEFSTVRRNLRIASKVPDFCVAGDHLENIVFEIVNPEGDVDTKIHHDDKDGQIHMLTIKSDFFNTVDSIRYTFKHGRCTIPSIPILVNDGTFCFEASHSRYTELCLIVKVPVIKMPKVEYDSQPTSPDKSNMLLLELPSFNQQNNLMISVLNNDDKEFDDICRRGEKIKEIEHHLGDFKKRKAETEQEMSKLLEKIQPYQMGNIDSSFTKDELVTKIKSMENSASSVLCNLSAHEMQQNYLLENIIGVVALLGTVQSPELSRVLAEYLGEDKMLGVICRSFDAASSLERYKQNGEVDCEFSLHAAAAALGKAIRRRFHVICFEDIRPYTGCLQVNDSQRKLALPYPKMPNGRTPDGFMGYAVNMIDLNINHLQTKTASGHGLRETVLFSLFKKLHVYKTRQSMVAARAYIQDGAVSLDGGILRENGILSLGYGSPFIYFPCENQMVLPPERREILTQIEEQKSYLKLLEDDIIVLTKWHEKYLKKFKKQSERYNKFMDKMEVERMK